MNISKDKPYVLDDRCIIPEYIKKMSKEELDREIARLEQEIRDKKREEQDKKAV